jgi:hypothetical protein
VHLGDAADLAEVAVGVAAGAGCGRAGAGARGGADRAVERLGGDQVLAAELDVLADDQLARRRRVALEALADQEVERVPVAPRLAHRAGLDVAEGGVAVGVDHQAVGQAVGVLVVDDVGLVGAVGLQERVGPVGRVVPQVHLHPRRDAVGRGGEVGVVDVVGVGHAYRRAHLRHPSSGRWRRKSTHLVLAYKT